MRRRREPSGDDWGVEQSRLALFFIFILFHVPTYKPKEDYPSLGTIYIYLLQFTCDALPVKRSLVKFVEIL
jgi:hypothetical protein